MTRDTPIAIGPRGPRSNASTRVRRPALRAKRAELCLTQPEAKALAAPASRTLAARDKLAAAEQELAHAVAACRTAGISDD